MLSCPVCSAYFFFQAEDGIRDADVTGVQTCALPISEVETAPPGCAVAADSTSAGPTRFPPTLSVSSLRPSMYQNPSSSTRAQSPCTQTSGNRLQYVARYFCGSRQNPRVMPGHGLRMTSSPTAPRTARPRSSATSAAMPGTAHAKPVGLSGVQVVQPRMPPAHSVPPE